MKGVRKGVRRLLRTVGLVSDGILVGLFLAGYLARYVPPEHIWWLQLVAIGLPYLGLVVFLAAAVYALTRKWAGFGVHVVLVVLMIIRLGNPFPVRSDGRAQELTLMTFNTGWGISKSAKDIVSLVRRESPDILAMQETSLYFAKTEPYIHPGGFYAALIDSLHYTTRLPDGHSAHISKPVLGRIPFDHLTEIPLAGGGENNRDYVRVAFSWQGRKAVLYNIHLRTFGEQKPWDDNKMRVFTASFWTQYVAQFKNAILLRAEEARFIKKRILAESDPVILCGDFNSTPNNWVYRYLLAGFTDAFGSAGHGWGATYHAQRPFVRIDYVFVAPAWEVISADVPETDSSDHRPLVVQLRWRP